MHNLLERTRTAFWKNRLLALAKICLFGTFLLLPIGSNAAPVCDRAGIAERLSNGESPLTIYSSCKKSMTNLYGQPYQGGLIAYLNPADGSGFVVAASDLPGALWVNMRMGYYAATFAYGTGIGSGASNTNKILQALGAPSSSFPYAAFVASQPLNGYSDWYLPSTDEMTQAFNYVITKAGCGSEYGWWTSTATYNGNTAYYLGCTGGVNASMQNNPYNIRPIRSFIDTRPTPPAAPQNVSASFTPGNNSATINVTYSAPSSNGGGKISGYNLYVFNAKTQRNASGTCNLSSMTCTYTNATLGTSYYLNVAAQNIAGNGPLSATQIVIPIGAPQVAATGSALAGPIAGGASISFTPNPVSASATTSYTVTSSPGNLSASCNASPCTITGLTAGTQYTFSVKANNASGSSSASSSTNSVTAGVPPAPSNVQVTPGASGVSVSFDAPSNAGSNVVYQITNNVNSNSVTCAASPCTIGLTQSGSYTYQVATLDRSKQQISAAVTAAPISVHIFPAPTNTNWAIPGGTTNLTLFVTGGGGGSGGVTSSPQGSQGGAGATAKISLAVGTNQTMDIIAGAGGNAGQNALQGGSGGGASAIKLGTTLLIAGGGGGGGAQGNPVYSGPAGGNAGLGSAGSNASSGGTGGGSTSGSGGYGANCPSVTGNAIAGTGDGGAGGNGAGSATGGTGIWSSNGATNGGNANDDRCHTSQQRVLSVYGGGGGGGGFGGGGGGGGGTATPPSSNSWAYTIGAGGGGGSTGPTNTDWSSANNGGTNGTQGGNGSVVIYY